MFTRLKIKDLTVFQKAEIELSQGLNVFIGENGSGKTHLLKATYCIPPGLAQEGDLLFDFPEDWQVSQYDTWSYYRNRFQRLLHRMQGGGKRKQPATGWMDSAQCPQTRKP